MLGGGRKGKVSKGGGGNVRGGPEGKRLSSNVATLNFRALKSRDTSKYIMFIFTK